MDRREKIIQYISNPINILFIILQIFIIAFLIISLSNLSGGSKNEIAPDDADINVKNETNDVPELQVSQLSEMEIPEPNIANIQRSLFSIAANNNTSIKTSGLKTDVRAKISKYFEKQKIHYQTFIVDIKDYKQSYRVTHEWADNEDNQYLAPNDSVTVSCVYEKDMIKYKDFNCNDDHANDPKYSIIKHYIEFAEFGDFSVSGGTNKINSLSVDMTYTSHNEDEVVARANKWIKSMGFSPEGFTYSFYYGESWGGDDNE